MSSPRQVRRCIDCEKEGVRTRRKAPYPGPRCSTHNRLYRRSQTAKRKSNHVQQTYNITETQYQQLLAAQGGQCYICHRRPGRKRLSVDHDHACCNGPKSCGRCVRGLLCSTCNKYLGHIRDNPEAMARGAFYLDNPPAFVVLELDKGLELHGEQGSAALVGR